MGIDAAEPERVDADAQRRGDCGQRVRTAHQFKVQRIEVDRRVQLGGVQRRRYFAVGEHGDGLGQPGHPGGRFEVTDVALDRADRQRRGAVGAVHRGDGRGLDRIADLGAGAVGLDVGDVGRVQAGGAEHAAHQLGLRVGAGNGQRALARAVGVDAAGADHRVDAVAVGERVAQRLEHQHCGTLGAHVAVGVGRERAAAAACRKHRRLGEADEGVGVQQQVDAAGQRQRRAAVSQQLARLVQRNQRRRAGGVHGQARATQVEHIRDAVRGDAHGVAGHRMRRHARQVVEHAHAVVQPRDADEHAAVASAQRRGTQAGVLDRVPAQFEQQPLLRVHQLGFARRNAEKGGVKSADVAQRAGGEGDAAPGLAALGVLQSVDGPARGVNFGDEIASFAERIPEAIQASNVAGQAQCNAYDGDGFRAFTFCQFIGSDECMLCATDALQLVIDRSIGTVH
ncbi:hypothetical protein GALL_285060 [mine drainage metagenome]|uniref:Uncharacterized protein n=1 Tax=mine drainage metagenome TaxID=410659 RepID=A0A1J5RJ24_9ZZZZ